jgi:hypothetical protein
MNDPIIYKRKGIMKEVLECNDNNSILIKGQSVDLDMNIPSSLIKLKKNSIHKVVFLVTEKLSFKKHH